MRISTTSTLPWKRRAAPMSPSPIRWLKKVEAIVAGNVPEVVRVVSTVGQKGQSAYEFSIGTGTQSNFAEITVELKDGKEYARASHRQIQERIRPFLEENTRGRHSLPGHSMGTAHGRPGADQNHRTGNRHPAAHHRPAVREMMEGIRGITDLKDDFSDAAPELRVRVDRARAAAMGIPLESLALNLRGATAGLDVREFRDERDVSRKYDLKVRFSPAARTSPNMLDSIKIRSDSGHLVPLSTIAEFSMGKGAEQHQAFRPAADCQDIGQQSGPIGRGDHRRTDEKSKTVSSFPRDTNSITQANMKRPRNRFESLGLAYIVAAILIFTLLVSQFNSLAQPFAILSALPLSVVGAMAGLYLTGNDFFHHELYRAGRVERHRGQRLDRSGGLHQTASEKPGRNMFDAIVAGGQQRLRPIHLHDPVQPWEAS